MSSSARDIANAANAQLSTGPVTEEGKAKSSQNARKHGLTAQDLVIPFEDREEYKHYVSQNGPIQQAVFDELVSSAWKRRSARKLRLTSSSWMMKIPKRSWSGWPATGPASSEKQLDYRLVPKAA